MKEAVLAALSTVDDPELGVDIVSLGLVRRLDITDHAVAIELMMTTPTCPLGGLIVETARAAVEGRLGAGWSVAITLDRQAEWTPDLATPEVRTRFERKPSSLAAAIADLTSTIFGQRRNA